MTQIAQAIAAASVAAELDEEVDPEVPARILVHCSGSAECTQVVVEYALKNGKVHHVPLEVLALRFEVRGAGSIRLVMEMAPDQVMLELLPPDVVVIEREKRPAERTLGQEDIPF